MDWGDFRFSTQHKKSEEDEKVEDIEEDGEEKETVKKKSEKLPEVVEVSEAPKTANDYEKLLLGSSQSSYVWIQYMAYWLGLVMLDKARETAKRAIQRIDPSKEKEKSDIWVAYLNMEKNLWNERHFYGSIQASITV